MKTKYKFFAPIIFLLFFSVNLFAQNFSNFIGKVYGSPEITRQSLVDSFLKTISSFPLMENDTTVVFLYSGNANYVSIAGDANSWSANATPMQKLSTTDLWYKTLYYEPDARLDYKFVINGSTWILDSRNKYTCSGGYGPNSELRMPKYIPAPEINYYSDIPHGNIETLNFSSPVLGNSRQIKIYTPPGYESGNESYPLVLFHDGLEYITLANANNVLDYLINKKRIKPLIGLFVPPVNRESEYAGNLQNQFGAFIIQELLPQIEAKYRVKKSKENRATIGASNGGNISLWLGYTYPDIFGNIGAYSTYIQPSLVSGFSVSPKTGSKIYIDIGTYDIGLLMMLVKNIIPVLESQKLDYKYRVFHEGHSWGNWKAHLDNSLEYFFPGEALGIEKNNMKPLNAALFQNYPNPFNPSTVISFLISEAANNNTFVQLKVYDILGREISTLVNEIKQPGKYELVFNASGFPSGIYFYQIRAGNFFQSNKMMLVR